MAAVRADNRPALIDLGPVMSTETLLMDAPYGILTVFHHLTADLWWMYTSEHSDADAVDAMFEQMPQTVCYRDSTQCRFAPEFKDCAVHVRVHEFISYRKGLPLARITPAFFFSTKVMGQLR